MSAVVQASDWLDVVVPRRQKKPRRPPNHWPWAGSSCAGRVISRPRARPAQAQRCEKDVERTPGAVGVTGCAAKARTSHSHPSADLVFFFFARARGLAGRAFHVPHAVSGPPRARQAWPNTCLHVQGVVAGVWVSVARQAHHESTRRKSDARPSFVVASATTHWPQNRGCLDTRPPTHPRMPGDCCVSREHSCGGPRRAAKATSTQRRQRVTRVSTHESQEHRGATHGAAKPLCLAAEIKCKRRRRACRNSWPIFGLCCSLLCCSCCGLHNESVCVCVFILVY